MKVPFETFEVVATFTSEALFIIKADTTFYSDIFRENCRRFIENAIREKIEHDKGKA